MGIFSDLQDATVAGQRINAVREQRAARQAAEEQRSRQAEAFKAIQGGDVLGAAAYDPTVAGQYQDVAAGETQRSAAEQALKQQAGLRAVRAAKALTPKFGGDAVEAARFVLGKAGNLFGGPAENEQLLQAIAEGGPEYLDAIEAGLTEPAKPGKQFYSTAGGLYNAETGQIVEGTQRPGKEVDPLDAEYKRAQIEAARALAEQRRTPKAADAKAQKAEEDQAAGKESLSNSLAGLAETYLALGAKGGAVVPGNSPAANLRARAESSGLGQLVGGAVGTENQSIRKRIKNLQPVLINKIRQATGMSAKAMDSNAELKFYLQAATDPESGDLLSNLVAIDTLDQTYGLGGVLDSVVPPEILAQIRAQTAPSGEAAAPAETGSTEDDLVAKYLSQ